MALTLEQRIEAANKKALKIIAEREKAKKQFDRDYGDDQITDDEGERPEKLCRDFEIVAPYLRMISTLAFIPKKIKPYIKGVLDGMDSICSID